MPVVSARSVVPAARVVPVVRLRTVRYVTLLGLPVPAVLVVSPALVAPAVLVGLVAPAVLVGRREVRDGPGARSGTRSRTPPPMRRSGAGCAA